MNNENAEKLDFIGRTLSLKEQFVLKDHERKKELMLLRDKLGKDNAILRNNIAEKRHEERIVLMKYKYPEIKK